MQIVEKGQFYKLCLKINLLMVTLYAIVGALIITLAFIYYDSFTEKKFNGLLISIIVLVSIAFVVKCSLRIAFLLSTKSWVNDLEKDKSLTKFNQWKKFALISGNYFCFSKINDSLWKMAN